MPRQTAPAHLLPYGLDKTGELRCVDDVAQGLACGCTCPGCGDTLVARKGKIVVHHFAHVGPECGALGGESALHLLAKHALAEHRRILLPAATAATDIFKVTVEAAHVAVADEVAVEVSMNGFRPDAVISVEDREVLVEFRVSHPVDEDKARRVREAGRFCVEIDLRGFDWSGSRADHERRILGLESASDGHGFSPVRQWIHHPAAERRGAELADEARREAAARKERLRRRLRENPPADDRPYSKPETVALKPDTDADWVRYVRSCHGRAVAEAKEWAARELGQECDDQVERFVARIIARQDEAAMTALGILSTYESEFLLSNLSAAVRATTRA